MSHAPVREQRELLLSSTARDQCLDCTTTLPLDTSTPTIASAANRKRGLATKANAGVSVFGNVERQILSEWLPSLTEQSDWPQGAAGVHLFRYQLTLTGQCTHREVQDISNRLVLPKANVGRLLLVAARVVQELIRQIVCGLKHGASLGPTGAFHCIAYGITFQFAMA
jgi:hypothetical protein